MRFAPALLLLALPACTPGATAIPPATASRSSPGTAAAWSPPPAGTSTAATADDAANLASLDATYAPLDRGEAVGDDDPGAIDDEVEEPPAGTPSAAPKPILHPLAGLSESDLAQRLRSEPESLGPISLGRPNGGQLINSVRMPQGEGWELIDPAHAWGTQETIDALVRAVQKVQNSYPDCPKLQVGHISSRKGGPLSPHVSHQTGRDVDVSYFYQSSARWFSRAHAGNLDRARTWAFVRALITETDVEMLLIDHSLQRLLNDHALSIGEDPEWVDKVFRGEPGKRPPLIRHARGHATHIHVRFFNPIAQETARRVASLLIKQGVVRSPTYYTMHKAKKGETLGMLARKYATTVEDIQRANGLRSTLIRAKRTYRIPRKGRVQAVRSGPVVMPERLLPPRPPCEVTEASGDLANGTPGAS